MTRLIASLAAALLAVAACSSTPSGGSVTPDPTIAFCAALDQYAVTLVKLDALPATATVEDYNAAVDTAKAGLAAVVAVAGPFVGAQLNEAQTAQTNLEAAADELPPGTAPAVAEIALDAAARNADPAGRVDAQCPVQHAADAIHDTLSRR